MIKLITVLRIASFSGDGIVIFMYMPVLVPFFLENVPGFLCQISARLLTVLMAEGQIDTAAIRPAK